MITFIPAGGLGNRMKSMAAAIKLAQATQTNLDIIWFQDWGLGCKFCELFLPLQVPNVKLREANWFDKLTRDIPRRRNLYIPKLFEQWQYANQQNHECYYRPKCTDFACRFCEWFQNYRYRYS